MLYWDLAPEAAPWSKTRRRSISTSTTSCCATYRSTGVVIKHGLAVGHVQLDVAVRSIRKRQMPGDAKANSPATDTLYLTVSASSALFFGLVATGYLPSGG